MKMYELTPAQKNFALLQSFFKGTSIATLCGIIIFDDLLERPALIDALKSVIKKHDALHLRFHCDKGKMMQYVADESVETNDNVFFMLFESEEEARKYALKEGKTVFDAEDAPMYRFTVFEIPDHTGIILSASHIVLDSWSYSVLAGDIFKTYRSITDTDVPAGDNVKNKENAGNVIEHICTGEVNEKNTEAENSIPDRKYSFISSFVRYETYLSSDKYRNDLNFWKERYEGGIEPTNIVPGRKNDTDPSSERRIHYLSPELSAKIKDFCARNSVSAATVFESAVLVYLSRINRSETVSINTMVLGRNNAAEKKTVGMYASVLPLTVSVNSSDTAAEICGNVMRSHREIYRRRDLPFSEIMSAVRSSGGISGRLTDVMVNFQNSVTEVPARTEWLSNGYNESAFVLNIDERDGGDRYVFSIDYQTGVFESEKAALLLTERIIHILGQITGSAEIRADEISLIPDTEREMLVYEFNDTDAELSNVSCVHEKISGLARKYPDRCALVFHGRKYTASELERLSDALAGELLVRDIGKGDIAALMCRRSPYMIIAMLAVMKTGAAYLPVSPDQPEERLKYMLEDVGSKLVLTFGCECSVGTSLKLEDLVSEENPEKSGFRDNGMGDSEKTDNVLKDRINIHCSPDDPCYMIFTSGSSGRPKGTVITHRNVINYSEVTEHGICGGIIKDEKSIVSVTDHVFDIFVTESLMALLDLKTIILADDNEAKSGKALGRLVRNTHSEVIQTTPTIMRSFMLDKNALEFLSCFKKIILGGEELPASLIKELKKHTCAKIFNIYGPAETTVWSSFTEADENDINIGKPLTNTGIYILDENRELLPSGIMGEICISGYGVGNGYPADPALTAEKFIPDKFRKGRMMYCTGDMGIMRADGNI
ncbi:MAG: AMP-binding protein, partial [Oscillospiraceae bacterium]|nr:AMP-binding protein [Oscillospiraceae bacterium]